MTKDLSPVIRVDDAKCVNCHTCISVCPVKLCIDGSGEKVSLDAGTCIACGQCVKACTHGARSGIDDLAAFLEAAARGQRTVAISAPAVAAKYPEDQLRLNGWLATLGVQAVFDVSFGAELTVESYIRHLEKSRPRMIIAQPCPAIVNYIELYQPELLPYLAPAQSPMAHTVAMIREFFPEHRAAKILVISPCIAKRREFDATGMGDFNVTLASLSAHLEARGVDLKSYPELDYAGPVAERASLFSSPGGLKETVERERPGLAAAVRKMEGPRSIYPYLKELPESIARGANPAILDCLNCEKGCNGGTGTGLDEVPADILEEAVRKRARAQGEKLGKAGLFRGTPLGRLRRSVKTYWKEGLYARGYVDRSARAARRVPNEAQLADIYRSMKKVREEDFLNCAACGYLSCQAMAQAIFNGLNKPDNCHHYRRSLLLESKEAARDLSISLDADIGRSSASLASVRDLLPKLNENTKRQAASLDATDRKISELLSSLDSSASRSEERKRGLEELGASAAAVQAELGASLLSVRGLTEQMKGIHALVTDINKIAAQTNLLSMNAAIEAAHAGSSGQGFAVVASEIRGLADRAGRSAAQITKTLADMAKRMQETASSTEHSGARIRAVLGDLDTNARGLGEIFTSLAAMSSTTGDVERSLRELSAASGSVLGLYRDMEEALVAASDDIIALERASNSNITKIKEL